MVWEPDFARGQDPQHGQSIQTCFHHIYIPLTWIESAHPLCSLKSFIELNDGYILLFSLWPLT